MRFQDTIDELLSAEGASRARRVISDLDPEAPEDWRTFAATLAVLLQDKKFGSVAIAGGQGSGKSTLARLLVAASISLGRYAICASLDDFYLTRSERQSLAEKVHPLLATRGVPGTHDIGLCLNTFAAVRHPGTVLLPRFDKSSDERCPRSQWSKVDGPVDLFILEGWCLGADPQPDDRLETPANALEEDEDRAGVWRRFVNDTLVVGGGYHTLGSAFEFRVFLAVPDMAAVVRWRTQQEQSLPVSKRMAPGELSRFVAHYERLTTWMLESMPGKADLNVKLAADHTVAEIEVNQR